MRNWFKMLYLVIWKWTPNAVRICLLRLLGVKMGNHVYIDRHAIILGDFKQFCFGNNFKMDHDAIIQFKGTLIIGNDVVMNKYSEIISTHISNAKVIIGNKVILGVRVVIEASGSIVIGDETLITRDNYIFTHKHGIKRNMAIENQPIEFKSIKIGKDVFIGAGAIINCGVTIADGCVIAPGAVITKDTKPYGVYGGIPAKKINERI